MAHISARIFRILLLQMTFVDHTLLNVVMSYTPSICSFDGPNILDTGENKTRANLDCSIMTMTLKKKKKTRVNSTFYEIKRV